MARLSTSETADRLGLTRQRVLQLIRAGKLKAERVGNVYILDARTVEAFAKLKRPAHRPVKPKK